MASAANRREPQAPLREPNDVKALSRHLADMRRRRRRRGVACWKMLMID